jgi:hypothetical protein
MVKAPRYSHVIGFDDAPFDRGHRGDVPVIAAVYAGLGPTIRCGLDVQPR